MFGADLNITNFLTMTTSSREGAIADLKERI